MSIASSFISGPAGITVDADRVTPSDIVLPQFDVKHCIGGTGKATVFLATHKDERRDVALKVVQIPSVLRQKVTTLLEREIDICRRLPACSALLPAERLHFVANKDGVCLGVIEMVFADGGSLRDWLRKHQDDIVTRRHLAVDIFRGLCTAVGAAHDAGIVHLDVKPENVLFVQGRLKLADFGAAVVLPHRATPESGGDVLLSPDPSTGTAEYMGPERWAAGTPGSVDERADIYSLGVILWELCSQRGLPPFEGSSRRVARLHAEGAVAEIAGIPEGLMWIIRKCMAKRPSDRYRHTDELMDALDDACAATTSTEATEDASAEAIRKVISDAMAARELSRAARWCERLLAILPRDEMATEVMAYVAERRAEADVLYQAITMDEDRACLSEAVCIMAQAMECFPGHPLESVTAIRLARQAEVFRENVDACVGAALSGNFSAACGLAARALALNRDATGVARLMFELEQQLSQEGRWRQRRCDALELNNFTDARLADRRLEQLGVCAQTGRFANAN